MEKKFNFDDLFEVILIDIIVFLFLIFFSGLDMKTIYIIMIFVLLILTVPILIITIIRWKKFNKEHEYIMKVIEENEKIDTKNNEMEMGRE